MFLSILTESPVLVHNGNANRRAAGTYSLNVNLIDL